jgi:conjugal transfer pilus assembly protein TrbC
VSATELHRSVLAATLAAALVVTAAPAALAQASSGQVTEADIARAARSQPAISDKDIEAARRRYRMPTDEELSRVPVPSTPRVDALPQPRTPQRIDLGAIARGFDEMGAPDPSRPGVAMGPALLVFVSFSMSDAALERLAEQAARSGATLVLRGLVEDSLPKTVTRVQRVIGQRKVGFQIDPQAFVPTPCAAGTCFAADSYALAAGDVSIDYALRFIQRSAPKFSRDANHFLARINGG